MNDIEQAQCGVACHALYVPSTLSSNMFNRFPDSVALEIRNVKFSSAEVHLDLAIRGELLYCIKVSGIFTAVSHIL